MFLKDKCELRQRLASQQREKVPCFEDVIDTSMAAQGSGVLKTLEQQGCLVLCLTSLLWNLLVKDFA